MTTTRASLSNEEIISGLSRCVGPEQVLSRLVERNAHANDASIYRLVPRVVVVPRNSDEVKSVLSFCRENGLYLTFRAAGTSLSGQAVTDGVLVDVARHFKAICILDGGKRVAVEPGVIGQHVNAFLAPYHAKIGPDPASINACMMGGIAANNASGMCCGVHLNSYHTLSSLRFMMADGFELDSADPEAEERLARERPQIHAGLLELRDRIWSRPALVERIRHKYAIKNTCGYSMNAFVDFEKPLDILSHLLIGSEGTLGFISQVTLRTIPDKPLKATALVYFKELLDAGAAVGPLSRAAAAVLEIMDRASMASVAEKMNYGFPLAGNCAALLVEFQCDQEAELVTQLESAQEILTGYELLAPVVFTRDVALQAAYWEMRKGLFPSVGAMREPGSAVIIEDVCVPPQRLAEAILDLQQLLKEYGFPEAIIYGHAKDGNLHFVISTDFSREEQVRRYTALLDRVMGLVVIKYDGSLKAEHGTGRNVAPYVELEWGSELYELMWEVKQLLDPQGVLNPGVILNHDLQVHVKNLKQMPLVSPIVDKCIECGFCEPRCPSRNLTSTPRQRIVLLREIERLRRLGDPASLAEIEVLKKQYDYYGEKTCAVDGMCATACPVKIDTGKMTKELRAASHSEGAKRAALFCARHTGWLIWGARVGLALLRWGGAPARAAARASGEFIFRISKGVLPRLPKEIPMPGPAPRLPRSEFSIRAEEDGQECSVEEAGGESAAAGRAASAACRVVYYPSCLTRIMGALPGEREEVGLAQAVLDVLQSCGWQVRIAQGIKWCCCGQPFASKGFFEASTEAFVDTVDELWEASEHGTIPVMCETSPCSGQLIVAERFLTGEALRRWKALKIYDFSTFMVKEVLPRRQNWPRLEREVVLHPTCTLIKLGALEDLKTLAGTFASHVTVPVLAECCGFAGDRGFSHPELTLSATGPEAAEVLGLAVGVGVGEGGGAESAGKGERTGQEAGEGSGADWRYYYSTCRTCEIGMSAATGKSYRSIVYLCRDALAGQ